MRTLEYTENILIVKLEYLIFRTEDSFQESVCYSGPNCVNFTQIPPKNSLAQIPKALSNNLQFKLPPPNAVSEAPGQVSVFRVTIDTGACHPRGCQLAWPSGHSSEGHQSHCKDPAPDSPPPLSEMRAGTRSPSRQLGQPSLSHHF